MQDAGEPDLQSPVSSFTVKVWEPSLGEELELHPDLLVLSMPMVPPEGAEELATRLKVPQDMDGFFLEAHVKLRPVDFASDGLYMAGAAHYPKFVDESIAGIKIRFDQDHKIPISTWPLNHLQVQDGKMVSIYTGPGKPYLDYKFQTPPWIN